MLTFNNKSILFLGALLLAAPAPAFAFGKKPLPVPTTPVTPPKPVPPPVTPVPPPTPSGDVIRARWDSVTRDGSAWSQYVYDQLPALAPNLLNKVPADIAQFCPAYSTLDASDQKNFWVYLVSSIAQLESDFDPSQIYTENFRDANGNLVQSIGLLQLSVQDSPGYGCGFSTAADVENADKNLACGLRILNKLVGQNGQLAGQSSSGSWLGGARYWSTLRSAKATQIKGWTNSLTMCAK